MTEAPLILCVDLDGVCADYTSAFRRYVAGVLGKDESQMGPQHSWSFSDTNWGIRDRDHFLELHTQAVLDGHMFSDMPEIADASDTLWRLSDRGVHIRVVTHRLVHHWAHHVVIADTALWLQEPRPDGRPRIPYRDICFLGAKPDVAGDILVDDAPHNIEAVRDAREHGRPAPQPIVMDHPYNRDVPGPRAYSWADVERYVEETLLWRRADPLAVQPAN